MPTDNILNVHGDDGSVRFQVGLLRRHMREVQSRATLLRWSHLALVDEISRDALELYQDLSRGWLNLTEQQCRERLQRFQVEAERIEAALLDGFNDATPNC
jgi:hypothetical protein